MALITRHVLISLAGGIVIGIVVMHGFHPVDSLTATGVLFSGLLTQTWIIKTLAFAVLVGSVMALITDSGGVKGFVHYVQDRRQMIRSQRGALMLAYITGLVIFIESSITSLIAGTVSRPLTDRYGVSREKLAYVCDSTSAPVCSLIVLNGWGALLLGLISTQIAAGMISGESTGVLLASLPYNFYAMAALAVTFVVIWFGIDIGPMRLAKAVHENDRAEHENGGRMGYMAWPIVIMIATVFLVLYITGNGNLLKGSGSSAIFYATLATVLFCLVYYVLTGGMTVSQWLSSTLRGARSMVVIALILLFAFGIGKVTEQLETGLFLASFVSDAIDTAWLGAIVFLVAAVMAFSTGTSWGTFSIMIPIAVPLAFTLQADMSLVIGAVISGGVFGDHCSPISDTTIISSMAAKCDHIEHVRTQLPYALASGAIALILFIVFGFIG